MKLCYIHNDLGLPLSYAGKECPKCKIEREIANVQKVPYEMGYIYDTKRSNNMPPLKLEKDGVMMPGEDKLKDNKGNRLYSIARVKNGYLLKTNIEDGGYMDSSKNIMVFNNLDDMCKWIKEYFS